MDHGFLTNQSYLVFGDTFTDRSMDSLAADVADPSAVFDHFDLFLRFDHALAHRVLRHINQFSVGEGILQRLALHRWQRIVFDTDAFGANILPLERFLQAVVEVVAAPVGVDSIVAIASTPWHTRVTICRVRYGF